MITSPSSPWTNAMGMIQIRHNPSLRELNQFGFIWLGFLIFFGLVA